MQQMDLFEPTTVELKKEIVDLKTEIANTRRGAFREITELKKECAFLSTQLERITDLTIEMENISYLLKEKVS